ncbi:D-2-hydroxyglutarate dehydrogenase, mitochondrial-like [Oppia nitens]|uniref:D-2-hydroxyglutarate dehydrogenase, mitochondrial-like n=1 Tax=Oppia nitens TaxID=1686743 RepID=UPI0023DBC9C3|nr:D-2-hydroxyglutarate dehydrogenase, mitochondrial-like [Oppia nitens]
MWSAITAKYGRQWTSTVVKRYRSLTAYDISRMRDLLGDTNVKTDDLDSFNTDWLHTHKGRSQLVLEPNTTRQVSQVMAYLNDQSLPCVIQSGNTSLVAGSVPFDDEIIISMAKMRQIISFDETSGILVTESGVVLQTLEDYVNERGYIMPYDLGAKGSCLIGGNLATNAGGLRFIRYGSLHGSVLGVEVVLPDGRLLDLMSCMRKDNTGYDLKQLFIGSEGTLGVITKVSIQCPLKLRHQTVALVAVNSFDDLLKIYHKIRCDLTEYLTTFEMMDDIAMDAVVTNLKQTHPLNGNSSPFYVMFKLAANDCEHMEKRLAQVIEQLMDKQLISDGTYVSDDNLQRFQKLKSYRERIAEGLLVDGYSYKYDISLPLNVFYEIVNVMKDRLKTTKCLRVCGYGHIGDSNLHLNMTSKVFDTDIKSQIEPFLYEYIAKHKGSISAEHGLGLMKNRYLSYSKPAEAISMMKDIKRLIDPKNILNPNKMLPPIN